MMPDHEVLAGVRGVILDLDGVVYRGDRALPGARGFIEYMSSSGRQVVALTNHSGRTASSYSTKLRGLGVDLAEEQVVSSGWATARFIARERRGKSALVVGTEALRQELARQGVPTSDEPELVVVGFVEELARVPLHLAVNHLLRGAELIATNPDALLPTAQGWLPECGPVTAYLETATGKRALVIGKPNPWIVELALERIGLRASDTLLVGDTLGTDIEAARAAGAKPALVLSGNTRAAPPDPDLLVEDDLQGLLRRFEEADRRLSGG